MHKELIISIIIVVFIFSLDYATQEYTDKTIEKTTSNLVQIKDDMRENNIDNTELLAKVSKAYDEWLEYHDKLAYYIEHDELEKVETNFTACRSFVESDKYDLALAELEKTIFVLEHISDKYAFNLENIF